MIINLFKITLSGSPRGNPPRLVSEGAMATSQSFAYPCGRLIGRVIVEIAESTDIKLETGLSKKLG